MLAGFGDASSGWLERAESLLSAARSTVWPLMMRCDCTYLSTLLGRHSHWEVGTYTRAHDQQNCNFQARTHSVSFSTKGNILVEDRAQ